MHGRGYGGVVHDRGVHGMDVVGVCMVGCVVGDVMVLW